MPAVPNRVYRLLRDFALVVLALFSLLMVAGWWMVRRSLPQVDGALTLPELRREVTVDRDAWGVPVIRAASEPDLLVAQGYVVAQDRLWQMDLLRRVAAGELAEIFGEAALPLDRENRTLGLRQAAERAAADTDPQTRALLEAYANGVNRYMESNTGRLPMEFALLGYRPRAWTPVDTFLIYAYMYKVLTTTWKAELDRSKVEARVGPERAYDLFQGTNDGANDHILVGAGPPVARAGTSNAPAVFDAPASAAGAPNPDDLLTKSAAGLRSLFGDDAGAALASNNFVIGGDFTYSGKPLLANDTHLPLGVPCIWYIVHLIAPGWNVKGFIFPGTPLVIIGHNERIAWGFTNNMADVQDLYLETFNPQNARQYLVNGNWTVAQVRREVIHVKGQPDETLEVVVTRHGPIVARDAARAYALRWTALEPGGMDFGFPLLGRAQNWDDFRAMTRHIAGPAQNAVYADVGGNIGYLVGARVPIRKKGDGSVPVPGDTDEYEWTGYIPYDEMPQLFNPPERMIATANARVVGPRYRSYLTDRWASPYRVDRIYDQLTEQAVRDNKKLRPEDCTAIQLDVVSIPDRSLAAELVGAGQAHPPADPQARELIAQLAGWDGKSLAGSIQTSFIGAVRRELLAALLRPYLGEQSALYNWWRDSVFLENVLRHRSARWLPSQYHGYDELLAAAADQAAANLRQRFGRAESDWRWGRVDAMALLHPLGRGSRVLSLLNLGPVEHNGSFNTVDAMGRSRFGESFGPAMRFVADLAKFDYSRMEITTGQSGQFGSEHYRDQFSLWLSGQAIAAPFTDAAEAASRVSHLRLAPAAPGHAR